MPKLSRREFNFRRLPAACGAALAIARSAPTAAMQAPGPQPYPIAVTVGNRGTIFVADHELKTVYRVDSDGKLAVLYKGSRKYRTPLYRVFAMAQDSAGNLFVCDTGSMDVWRLALDGKLAPLTGQKIARGIGPAPENQDFDSEAAYAGKFDKPMGITIDAEGNPIVADLGLAAIFRIVPGEKEPQEIARVPAPHGIALDRDGGFVVVSQGKDQLVRVSTKGEVTPIVKGALAPKNNPHYVVVDDDGYFVSDNYAKAVWRVSRDGQVKPLVQGEPLVSPVGLAREADGNLLVADPHAKKLFRVSREGQVTTVASFGAEEQK